MDATRPHLSFPAEWITAIIFLAATFAVGSLIIREIRATTARNPIVVSTPEITQPAIPDDAVAVSRLMLGEGVDVAVGEAAALAETKLGAASMIAQVSERGPLGPREIRSYDLAGTRFIIVLEPFERRGEPRVAAIYLR